MAPVRGAYVRVFRGVFVALGAVGFGTSCAVIPMHAGHIFQGRDDLQVIGANTKPVTAQVIDLHPIRDLADPQFVAVSVDEK